LRLVTAVFDLRKFNNVRSPYHRAAKNIIENLTANLDLESAKDIPSNTKLKLQWYMAECLYSCEKFNNLSRQTSTANQRKTYLLAGALGAMCDFIIDDVVLDTAEIMKFKKPLKEDHYSKPVEKLYAIFYHALIKSLEEDKKAMVLGYYQSLFDAQLRSKKQNDQNISREEVDEICKEKGGYSLLFLRALINGKINDVEERALYEVGAYIQYCNDAQDLHKDLMNDVKTFASTRAELEMIASELDKQKTIAFSLLKETHYHEEEKDYFLFTLYIMGIGILAKLHRYLKICNYNFSLEKLSTKSKEEVRSQLFISKLLVYSFPRVLKYNYEAVDKNYNFNLNLTNLPK
jgi:flagellin-specific chaperone FliS